MTQTTDRPTQAIVPRDQSIGSALVPTNLQQAASLANQLAKSALIPKDLRDKPQDVLVILLKGHELGLAPMQALSSIHVIQGKAVCEAALMVGLCLSHPDVCSYFTLLDSTDASATYETHRRGSPEPVQMTYTFAQAQAAKLTGKDNWTNHRAAMLRARASSALARAVYPDLCAGIYTPDEAAEFTEPAPRREPRRVTQAKAAPAPEAAATAVPAEDINLGGEVPGQDIIPPAGDEPPHPAETQEPGDDDGPPCVTGVIEKVLTSTGSNSRGPWTRYAAFVSGYYYVTFSESMGALAQKFCDTKQRARLVYKMSGKGRDIVELVAA